jgi:uncharacterized lipoprotein YbaY/uncharacterized membrane protein
MRTRNTQAVRHWLPVPVLHVPVLHVLMLLVLACTTPARGETIAGQLVLRDAGAIPPGAQVAISLRVTDGPSRLGHAVAETRFAAPPGSGPIAFRLAYEAAALAPGKAHALAARITLDGTTLWLNVERVAVDARRGSDAVAVPLARAAAAAERPVMLAEAARPAPKQAGAARAEPPPAQTPPRVALSRPAETPPPAPAQPAPELRQVALAAPAPVPPDPAPPSLAGADTAGLMLRCLGHEPGWRLLVQGSLARFSTQADAAREIATTVRYSAAPWADPPFAMLRTELPGAGTAVAVLTGERCTDSMSGDLAPIRVRLSLPDGTLRTGCCAALPSSIGQPVAAPGADAPGQDARDDWAHLLPLLLPAVQACTVARPGMVVRAWPMLNGKAGVRIVAPDGTRHDCLADLASRRVERVGVVVPVEPMPGEGRPVYRPGIMARAEACRVVQPVRGPDGAPVGSLAWETCG